MGKGLIIGASGGGLYQVELQYDRSRLTAELATLADKIANIDIYIADETTKKAALDLELYNVEHGADPEKTAWYASERVRLNKLIQAAARIIALANLQRASYQRRIDTINEKRGTDPIVEAWCADLTEDLTGEVGTIEVPGERSGGVNIQPGWDGYAAYDKDRDGKLQKAIAGTPACVFYNLAMTPGWQRWQPTYRYGTITFVTCDVCSVTLEAATSALQGQDLDVNPTVVELEAVPINYMDGDSKSFEVGDEVIIEFIGQDWATPQVIGFKISPKREIGSNLLGDYSITYTTNTMGLNESQTISIEPDTPLTADFNPKIITSGAITLTNSGSCTLTFLDFGGADKLPRWTLTAPASNPGCDNPADLTLTVCDVENDNAKIAVNSYGTGVNAYFVRTMLMPGVDYCAIPPHWKYGTWCCASGSWSLHWTQTNYYCDGTISLYVPDAYWSRPPLDVCNNPYNYLPEINDWRTPAMIAAGCCPGDLL